MYRRPDRRKARRRSAFTLLELLIVLAIIVAITAMVAPNLISSQQDSKISITQATIKTLEEAVKRKAVDNEGSFPTEDNTLRELSEKSTDSRGRERAPYLEEYKRDAWNNEFHYEYDSARDLTKPRIWSNGPDGKDDGGSGDDITNWKKDDEK